MKNSILQKAELGQGLSPDEIPELFNSLDGETLIAARRIAEKVREQALGRRASFYTCLYVTNACANDCPYCGFRKSNRSLKRITLTPDQVAAEAGEIKKLGIRNIILIGGTLPAETYSRLILASTKILAREGLNPWIEFENLPPDILSALPKLGARRFVLFQETYAEKYQALHKKSPYKEDPEQRQGTISAAVSAGFREIGIGALLGLDENPVTEILGLYRDAKALMQKGIKVSISFPRLTPAPGLSIKQPPHGLDYLAKSIITLRLALPQASLALSGREYPEFRDELFGIVDEIGSSGIPNPGGRTVFKDYYQKGDKQFSLFDLRQPKEIESVLKKRGIAVD